MSGKYTVAIIDDEITGIKNLQESLDRYSDFELIGIANDTISGWQLIQKNKPDLLFLDVEMPGKTGIEFMTEMQQSINWNMHVVFYTAYNKYLIDALRVSAFDFLLKPYQTADFDIIIQRFYLTKSKSNVQAEILKTTLATVIPANQTFMLTTIKGFLFIKLDEILFFEYNRLKKSWKIVLTDSREEQLKRGTTADTILHYSASFVQISQCHIINIEYLSVINDNNCILFPPYEHHSLKISRSFLRQLQERYETI